jgi:hypothetical protein
MKKSQTKLTNKLKLSKMVIAKLGSLQVSQIKGGTDYGCASIENNTCPTKPSLAVCR